MNELTDEQVDAALDTPAINAGVAIMDRLPAEVLAQLGALLEANKDQP